MLRRSHTAVLEKNETYTAGFETEPYETAWASEALWFVRVLELSGAGARMIAQPQISPDGLFWCDIPSRPLEIAEPGLYSQALRDFGGWLRLRCQLVGQQPKIKLMIYLALKE